MSRPTLRLLVVSLLFSVSLVFARPAQAQELVTNGGFETGDFTGWNNVFAATVTTPGVHGNYAATFGPDLPTPPFLPSITQTLATTSGATYTLSFDLEQTTPLTYMRVYFGSSGFPVFQQAGTGDGVHTLTVTADPGSSTDLQFWADINDQFVLDDVSVTLHSAAVPELGSVALWLSLSVGGVAVCFRQQRAKALPQRPRVAD